MLSNTYGRPLAMASSQFRCYLLERNGLLVFRLEQARADQTMQLLGGQRVSVQAVWQNLLILIISSGSAYISNRRLLLSLSDAGGRVM